LRKYLDGGGRKVDHWYAGPGYATADCSDVSESFSNINAPADMRALEEKLA
jgi:molybdopterin-guanine dinucleotide biosynthesis protein A